MALKSSKTQKRVEDVVASDFEDVYIRQLGRLGGSKDKPAKTESGTYNFVMLFDTDYFETANSFQMLQAFPNETTELVNGAAVSWIYSGAREVDGDSFNDPAYDLSLDNYTKNSNYANSQLQVQMYFPVIFNPVLDKGTWDGQSGEFGWLNVVAGVNFPDDLDSEKRLKQHGMIFRALTKARQSFNMTDDDGSSYRYSVVVGNNGQPETVKEDSLIGRVMQLTVNTKNPKEYYVWDVQEPVAADVSTYIDSLPGYGYNLYNQVYMFNGKYILDIVNEAAKFDSEFADEVKKFKAEKMWTHEADLFETACEVLDTNGIDIENIAMTSIRKPFFNKFSEGNEKHNWDDVIPYFWAGPPLEVSENDVDVVDSEEELHPF